MALTRYYWDSVNDNVMKEKDENGDTIATYTHEPGQFGELISQRRDGQTSYYQYDGQGSTRQLTDENGDVTDTYTYSAFGETVAKSGTTTNPFGYIGSRGYYTDAETDEVYVRARVYQPVVGRWLSRDPLRFPDGIDDILNQYAYSYKTDSEDKDTRKKANFEGCTEDEAAAIRDAYNKLCQKGGVFTNCSQGTGLTDCLVNLCSGKTSKWTVSCSKCENEQEGTGGYTTIGNVFCGKRRKCKPVQSDRKNITFCRGKPENDGELGPIPHPNFLLEEIWIHEMLHNCCLDHNNNSPPWEKKIFNACVKKCLGDIVAYLPGDEKDCKCPDC